jgi:hypothetical protein
MGRIKSALEIAMEKTEGVQGDKASIGLFEAKQQGKKLANEFLAGNLASLEEAVKKAPREKQESLRQGCFDVLVSQITLPQVPEDLSRLEQAGKGLSALIGNKRFAMIYQQFIAAGRQFLEEASHYEEAIKRQYAPKLKQKEEELSRRFGRTIRLDPFQDPEFIAFFNQNMNALKGNYEALSGQVQEQARLLFNGEL